MTAHIEGDVFVKKEDHFIIIIDKGIETAVIYDMVFIGVASEFRDYDMNNLAELGDKLKTNDSKKFPRDLPTLFIPPEFGVTVLGSSHGFDPKGSTSGYIFWINGR